MENINQKTSFDEFEKAFRLYVRFDEIKEQVPITKKEIDKMDIVLPSSDFSNFIEEYKLITSKIERITAILGTYVTIEKLYSKWFDKLLFLKIREKDAPRGEKERQKHYVDLELMQYHLVKDDLDIIISKSTMLKEIYITRQHMLSRLLAYLDYRKVTVE